MLGNVQKGSIFSFLQGAGAGGDAMNTSQAMREAYAAGAGHAGMFACAAQKGMGHGGGRFEDVIICDVDGDYKK
jgi:hypothetical protein